MSDTKPTPGPWSWRDADELRQARGADNRYGAAVLVAGWDYDRGPYLDATDADRDLIAAAPDLLAALEAAVEHGMVPSSSVLDGGAASHSAQVRTADQIRAAIRKAKGETV
jgi:hypothetical protein